MKSWTDRAGASGRRRSGRTTERIEPHRHDAAPAPIAAGRSATRAAAMFRALGDAARLVLLERLAEGEACVTDLAGASGDNLTTVSERLKVLHRQGLVDRRREGKHVIYTLADDHVAALIRNALDHAREPGRDRRTDD